MRNEVMRHPSEVVLCSVSCAGVQRLEAGDQPGPLWPREKGHRRGDLGDEGVGALVSVCLAAGTQSASGMSSTALCTLSSTSNLSE